MACDDTVVDHYNIYHIINMVTLEEIQKKYSELMLGYTKAKPLLNDVYKRNGGVYPDAILNEIRAMNDHIARFYDDSRNSEQRQEELAKADGHLKRMIYDAYKQLNIFFFDSMDKFEKEHFGAHWLHVKKGDVWLQYSDKRDEVVEYVRQAKIKESISTESAMESYAKAYVTQRDIYKLIEDNSQYLVLNKWKRWLAAINSQKGWLLSTFCLAVIPALLWKVLTHWSKIWTFFSTHVISILHRLCEWGLSL